MGFAARAQAGTIEGKAVLSDGSDVPGVLLTITPLGEGVERTAVTSDQGEYKATGLPPGEYELRAELEGFPTLLQRTTISVEGQVAAANFLMEFAAQNEEIIVTAAVDSFGNGTSPLSPRSEGPHYLTLFGQFPFGSLVINDGLDTELEGVQALAISQDQTVPTDIYFGAPNQMAVLLGPEVRAGDPWSLRICRGETCSDPYALNIGRHVPYVATVQGNGLGAAAAQDIDFSLITRANPMRDVGTFWVNGLAEPDATATLFLGGQAQDTLYYGLSGIPGLTQYNGSLSFNTPAGRVMGYVQETRADGSTAVSQPFQIWVNDGGQTIDDFFYGALTGQIFSADGLDVAEANLSQARRIDLDGEGAAISDSRLFTFGFTMANRNGLTFNLTTAGNFDAAIVPSGYQDPRTDLAAEGTVDVSVAGFTEFSLSSGESPGFSQFFSDPADRTFEGDVRVGFSGTIEGAAAELDLTGTYERPNAAIEAWEIDTDTALRYARDFPRSVLESAQQAAVQAPARDHLLFFIGFRQDYGAFGSTRVGLTATAEQLAAPGFVADAVRQFDVYSEQWSQDAPGTGEYFWSLTMQDIEKTLDGPVDAQRLTYSSSTAIIGPLRTTFSF